MLQVICKKGKDKHNVFSVVEFERTTVSNYLTIIPWARANEAEKITIIYNLRNVYQKKDIRP